MRTILLIGREALLLNDAAKMDDLALATCQIMLSIFGLLALPLMDLRMLPKRLLARQLAGRTRPCFVL